MKRYTVCKWLSVVVVGCFLSTVFDCSKTGLINEVVEAIEKDGSTSLIGDNLKDLIAKCRR